MGKIRKQIKDIIMSRYTEDELPEINIAIKGDRIVCRNCGREDGCFSIVGNPNNYCGNCGIRLGMPYVQDPF